MVRPAIGEANASGEGPHVELTEYGCRRPQPKARDRRADHRERRAGCLALAVEPVYAEHGLVAIGTSATVDGDLRSRILCACGLDGEQRDERAQRQYDTTRDNGHA